MGYKILKSLLRQENASLYNDSVKISTLIRIYLSTYYKKIKSIPDVNIGFVINIIFL